MAPSRILRRVALVRTDVSEVPNASFIRNTSVCLLVVTASVVPSSPILVTLMKDALSTFEALVRTRATQRNIPEDGILHSHRRENLKSYTRQLALSSSEEECRDGMCTSTAADIQRLQMEMPNLKREFTAVTEYIRNRRSNLKSAGRQTDREDMRSDSPNR
jgi:hypothetical protein